MYAECFDIREINVLKSQSLSPLLTIIEIPLGLKMFSLNTSIRRLSSSSKSVNSHCVWWMCECECECVSVSVCVWCMCECVSV